jgi:hypothetical protein
MDYTLKLVYHRIKADKIGWLRPIHPMLTD